MKQSLLLLLLICICSTPSIYAQNESVAVKKELNALRITEKITIDGYLNEAAWENAPIAGDFVEGNPNPGETPNQKTEVKVLYDDEAIYIGAFCYDTEPTKILKALSARDEISNTDFFLVVIDAFEDGINGVGFVVTASGVQFDEKYSASGNDQNWNAVWNSGVSINEEGWIAEYRIPFSALRFPNKDIQQWNLNFGRDLRRDRERSWWNPIDPEVRGFLNQAGKLKGITNVEAPIRLFLYPYVSGIVDFNDGAAAARFAGGMDIKYGLTDAFTLDATLIPDFSQVRSDNQVLNLSPFEVAFEENRQFFTEGIELFNKANLFYSRRIGGTPLNYGDPYDDLADAEKVTINPTETKLLNATKISGRTKNNTGLGIFNAIVGESFATIEDTLTGKTREVKTNSRTNYNIVSFDQGLKNNSYFTIINTNVLREGLDYDANVLGTEFEFRDKNNKYSLTGGGAYSKKFGTNNDTTDSGYKYNIGLSKIYGQFTASLEHVIESKYYDPNDLGLLFNPNENTTILGLNWNQYEPVGPFNRIGISLWQWYSRLQEPSLFSEYGFNFEYFFITKKFFAFGGWFNAKPFDVHDFFEPRVDGREYLIPKNIITGGWISTDYRKALALDFRLGIQKYASEGRHQKYMVFSPRWRVNDRLLIIHEYEVELKYNDEGYVDYNEDTDEINFGIRQFDTHTNTLNISYIFTNTASINFRARHLWATANYQDYALLEEDGSLNKFTSYTGMDEDGTSAHDRNFNAFTIDTNFRWQFWPGSELNLTWKNAIFTSDNIPEIGFGQNFKDVMSSSQNNSISLRVLFFIDYLNVQKRFRS